MDCRPTRPPVTWGSGRWTEGHTNSYEVIDHPKEVDRCGTTGQFDRDEESGRQRGRWNSLLGSRFSSRALQRARPPASSAAYSQNRAIPTDFLRISGELSEFGRDLSLPVPGRRISVASLAHLEGVQPHSFENQCLQRSLIDSVAFVEVDGAN